MMMTKEQKEHKIKLIYLIIIVNVEYARRKPFNNIYEIISFVYEQVFWARELARIVKSKTFKSGMYEIQDKRQ